jgi:cell division septation protein DedD
VDNLSQVLSAIDAVIQAPSVPRAQQAASRIVARERGIPEPVVELPAPVHDPREGWVLQLGAFSNMENAARLAAEVADYGANVSIQARVNDGYCHVLVGPYADEDMAMQALEKIRQLTGYHGDILPADRHGMLTDCVR